MSLVDDLKHNTARLSADLNYSRDGFTRIVKDARLVSIESPIYSKFSYGFKRKVKTIIDPVRENHKAKLSHYLDLIHPPTEKGIKILNDK